MRGDAAMREQAVKELEWITEIRLDSKAEMPNRIQRVMMFSGFASSPEVLRDLGTAIHERLSTTVLMRGLPRHDGDKRHFYSSRAWHYWREAEEPFLRYWKERGTPVTLVGYSTGANVAITIAARHPSKVAGIVLLSPYLRAKSATTRALSYGISGLYYLALPLGTLGSLAYICYKRCKSEWTSRRTVAVAAGSILGFAAATKIMDWATIGIGKAPALMRGGEEIYAPHFERVSLIGGSTLVPFQLLTRWINRHTVVPVTYVFGAKDSVVDVESGVMIAHQNPKAELFILSDAPHRIVTEPRVYDIVCTAVLRCFDESAARQQDFEDVDILPSDLELSDLASEPYTAG
jgi:pimeloyl-ACP methyl ester carboxylesterase